MMAARTEKTTHPGVYKVHRRTCSVRGAACTCQPAYQAVVSVFRDGKRLPVRRHFASIKAACAWRQDASSAARVGKLTVPTRTTLWEAAKDLIDGMRTGRIYDRSGRPYKPSTIRGYDTHLRTYILPALGGQRLSAITRRDLQVLLERLRGEPLSLSRRDPQRPLSAPGDLRPRTARRTARRRSHRGAEAAGRAW